VADAGQELWLLIGGTVATYYWVGGNGTWDTVSTANWSLTSGGAGGAGVPTTVDDVVFDGLSGTALNTVTIDAAVCANFLSTVVAAINFNGAGSSLEVYGSFIMLATPSSGSFNVDFLNVRVSVATGTVFESVSSFTGATFRISNNIGSQATVSLNSNITCNQFQLTGASLVPSGTYSINCINCEIGPFGPAYTKILGSNLSNLTINITPTVVSTISFSCQWAGVNDELRNVFVTINGGVSSDIDTLGNAAYATSFNLTLNGTTISQASIQSGLNNLTLLSGAIVKFNNTVAVFGNVSISSTSTLDQDSVFYPGPWRFEVRKKTGSPNVARTITNSGSWFGIGVRNLLSAGTDTLSINGSFGSALKPIESFLPGASTVGAGTIYADTVTLATGVVLTNNVFNVPTTFTIAVGAIVTGNFTVNSPSTINANGGTIPILNIAETTVTVVTNVTAGTMSITRTLAGTLTFQVQNGSTVTVSGSCTIAGTSPTANVVLKAYDFFVTPVPWYISKASGTVNAQFTTISYSNAIGGASFQALEINGCVDGGNNTGWIFKATTGNFFLFL
jgi:hypothetical protein